MVSYIHCCLAGNIKHDNKTHVLVDYESGTQQTSAYILPMMHNKWPSLHHDLRDAARR